MDAESVAAEDLQKIQPVLKKWTKKVACYWHWAPGKN